MRSHVKRVARFSTGTVDIHPEHAHRGNVDVIEHSDGVVVFDTGESEDSAAS